MSAAPPAGGDLEEAFRRACLLEADGKLEEALEAYFALRARLGAPNAALEMQIASACSRRGDAQSALEALRRAIAARPDQAAARINLAVLLMRLGRAGEARESLRQATAALPLEAPLWTRLASLEADAGNAGQALECLAKAAATIPAQANAWREIAQGYLELFQYPEADRALTVAAALDPGAPEIESLAVFVKQELGDAQGARQALERATRRAPHDLRIVLKAKLLLPQVYEDQADLDRWRARYVAGLADVLRERDRLAPGGDEIFEANQHNFLLAYQGEDDRQLQRDYSTFIGEAVQRARPGLREPRPIRFDGSRRLRVGFLGTIFRDCTPGRYFERWITGLDPERFERFVYQTGAAADEVTRRIAAGSEHFTALRLDPREVAERVLADELDVLVHPEVGMAAVSYLYAAMRLAPVQAAGWGHPVTTGSDTMDYYFTCDAMEPADAQDQYTERLVRLPGIGVDYSLPSPPPPGTREQLGLPTDRRIYLCAQSLFKVHPEMDEMLAAIAEADAQAVLLFFQGSSPFVTQALAQRLQRALARRGIAPRSQVRFLPRMESSHFRRVLALADVVLDTPRWSGGNTSIDAFAAGVPVVTLPGRFMRGRQTAGMLQLMDMPELVASDGDAYARLAVAVARDRERNQALRRKIAERRAVLFDRGEPVAELARTLLRMGAGEAIY